MNVYDDDALDRALFALPLEEPPAELRTSILAATAYRPGPAFSFWEVALLGGLAAVAVWFVTLLVMGGSTLFVHTFEAIGAGATGVLTNATTLTWLAAGGATAVWLSLFTGSQLSALASNRSDRPSGR